MKNVKKLFYLIIITFFTFSLSACSLFLGVKDKDEENTPDVPNKPTEKIEKSFLDDDVEIISKELEQFGKVRVDFKVKKTDIKQVVMFYKTYSNQEIVDCDYVRLTEDIISGKIYSFFISVRQYSSINYFIDVKFILETSPKSYDGYRFNYLYLDINGKGQIIKAENNRQTPYLPSTNPKSYVIVKDYYYDIYFNKKVMPNDLITKNEILYAKTTLDFNIINKLQQEIIRSNVTIYAQNYSSGSQGSGAVFYENHKGYYILTNSHVVTDSNTNLDYHRIEVENYNGKKINARLLTNKRRYDLAILYVSKGYYLENNIVLEPLKFAKDNPNIGEQIIAIGQPKDQKNTITTGYVQNYERVRFKTGMSPNFKAIKHNAPIDHGSSGGILLNTKLEICGINFAGSTSIESINANSYAIPIAKVREMIIEYNSEQ